MKKMLSIILCICMLSSLSACTTNDATTNEDTTKETLKSLSSFSEPNKNETFDYTGYTTRKLYDWGEGLVIPVEKPENTILTRGEYIEGYRNRYELTFENETDSENYCNKLVKAGWNRITIADGSVDVLWTNNMKLELGYEYKMESEENDIWKYDKKKADVFFTMGKDSDWDTEFLDNIEKQISDMGYTYNRINTPVIEFDTGKITDNKDIRLFQFYRHISSNETEKFISYLCLVENGDIILFGNDICTEYVASEMKFLDMDSDGTDELIVSSECLDMSNSARAYSTIRVFKRSQNNEFELAYNYLIHCNIESSTIDYRTFYSIGEIDGKNITLEYYDQDSISTYYYNKMEGKMKTIQKTKTDMYLTYKDGKYIIENQKDIKIIEESDKMIEY